MKTLSLFDKTFSLSKITAYSLSLQIDYYNFSYTIIDNLRKRFVAIVNYNFEPPASRYTFLNMVDEIINKDTYLQKPYKEVNFIYPSNKFMLMPEKYFERQKLKFYFEIDNILEQGEEILFNCIPELKAYLLFAIPSDITNYFVNKFPIINFYQQGIPVIKNYLSLSLTSDKLYIIVNFIKKFLLDIIVIKRGKLLFYNIFNCQGENQAIYDIVRVVREYDLKAQVNLLGSIDKKSKIYRDLYNLGLNISFAHTQPQYIFEFGDNVEAHNFASLLYLSD